MHSDEFCVQNYKSFEITGELSLNLHLMSKLLNYTLHSTNTIQFIIVVELMMTHGMIWIWMKSLL